MARSQGDARTSTTGQALPGARPSPNIWHTPEIYERENHAFDRDDLVWSAMQSIRGWDDSAVLDIGCGTGFHLPRFAASARHVYGVEPHASLAAIARRRTRRLDNVVVLDGLAEQLPVAPASIDVAHARWAYFFGPGSEPGLAELDRVMRRGGVAFVIDNDRSRSTFGEWFARGFPDWHGDPSFWTSRGWQREHILTDWRFDTREDFEAVVRIEFRADVAQRIIDEWSGTSVDYAVNLWWCRY